MTLINVYYYENFIEERSKEEIQKELENLNKYSKPLNMGDLIWKKNDRQN